MDSTTIATSSSDKHFFAGTRVDCLFEDEYFRGTVDALTNDGKRDLFRVCFDDGMRSEVPLLNLPTDINWTFRRHSKTQTGHSRNATAHDAACLLLSAVRDLLVDKAQPKAHV